MKSSSNKKRNGKGSVTPSRDRKDLNDLLGRKEPSTLGEKMLASLTIPASSTRSPSTMPKSSTTQMRETSTSVLSESIEGQPGDNNTVEKRFPYRRHCRSDMEICYRSLSDLELTSDQRMQLLKANPSLWESARRILRAKHLNDEIGLDQARKQLIRDQVLNLVIFDVQATSVPRYKDGKMIYPSIIQISLFHPLTGKHLTTYLTPCKPISYEVGFLSGVYNSLELTFSLPDVDETCSPLKINTIKMLEYANYSLLERPDIKERFEYYSEEEKLDSNSAADAAVQDFLSSLDPIETKLVVLDDLDRDQGYDTPIRKAPLFLDVIDDIFQFLSAGEGNASTTVLMAHNCNLWGEPLLKAEFERYCVSEKIQEWIFLDSGDIYSRIYAKEQISPGNFSRLLGEKRKEGFNTITNVFSLWKNIEYVSESIFGRKDLPFLYSKLVEELFLAKKT